MYIVWWVIIDQYNIPQVIKESVDYTFPNNVFVCAWHDRLESAQEHISALWEDILHS